jgi:ribosomal protein L11 methyltransferase
VVIDPGQAFGTGSHPTTRLCLELLIELPFAGSFLDLGCGSGVLAIAAARLGFAPVRAMDNDPAAVAATSSNAALNRVDLEVRRLDLRSQTVPYADTVAANLLAALLECLARRLVASPRLPRHIIAGGLLAGEAESIAAAFGAAGLRETRRREQAGWAALLLESAPTQARDDLS